MEFPPFKDPAAFGFRFTKARNQPKLDTLQLPPPWESLLYIARTEGVPLHIRHEISDEYPFLHICPASNPLSLLQTDGNPPLVASFSRGISEDYSEALSKAVGEFLERYPLLIYKKNELRIGSISQIAVETSGKYLNPSDMAGCSDRQKDIFPEKRFDNTALFGWIRGISLTRRTDVLLPAQYVFWNYCHEYGGFVEPTLREPNTNGAGGFFTLEGALLSGMYELIQRDGFLIYWLTRKAPPAIDIESIEDATLRELIAGVAKRGLEIIFLDTTTDLGIPSVACVLRDIQGKTPKLTFGGGCELNPLSTLKRSLIEALGVRHWAKKHAPSYTLPTDYKPFGKYGINQAKRIGLWGTHGHDSMNSFLSGKKKSFKEFAANQQVCKNKKDELDTVIKIFRKMGPEYEIFYYRSKHTLLQKLGYESVRVIVPALVPLYMHEENAPLGASRLQDVPTRLGFKPANEPNPLPHPFP